MSDAASLKDQVLARYQESLDQLAPIMRQLRATDALIDAIVYRLYGLSPEDVAVVEGRALPRVAPLTVRCQERYTPDGGGVYRLLARQRDDEQGCLV